MTAIPHETVLVNVGQRVVSALEGIDARRREYFGTYADAPWSVNWRPKTAGSIREKIARKRQQGKIDYGVEQLTDLVGVRVVVEGRTCAEHLARIVRGTFSVREKDSEAFMERPREDGYRGIHLILDLQPDGVRGGLVPVELQIRTILQHQWSIFSHSEFYKQVAEIPSSMLVRMRALSEILNCAEIESDQLRRNRIADEGSRRLHDMLHVTIERLADEGDPQIASLGLHLLEAERKLRRTLISDGARSRAALRDLVAIGRVAAVPTHDIEVASLLGDLVKRARVVVTPCYHDGANPEFLA